MSHPCRNFVHVFEGSGFGVGLTVDQLDVPPWATGPEPDWHPARLGELMPVAARSDAGLAEEMRRANIADSRLWAYRAELIAQLAARRSAHRDRAQGRPGAAVPGWVPPSRVLEDVSEWLPDEVAMIMNCSRAEAATLTEVALTLTHRLPSTWAALADGELNWARARAVAAEINRHGPDVDQHLLGAVEAVVLPQAAELSVTRLRALVRTEVVRRDGEAAERRRKQAAAAADVFIRRSALEGMSEVVTLLPAPVAAAVHGVVDAHARLAKQGGNSRPIGHLRAQLMADLVLRPWDDTRPAVTVELRILAPLSSLLSDPSDPRDPSLPGNGGQPPGAALVGGEAVTSRHLRALLTALDAVCPGGLQAPTGGSMHLDLLGSGGNLVATLTRRELEQAVRRGCPSHADGDCGCPVIQRPPPTDRYTPTALQRRWTTARDRQCRHPGCGNGVGWVDLDHVVAYADGGPTDCDNLCCLCRRHHRLKTHAPGWSFSLDSDGTLVVTTPSGVTRVSRPPGSELLEPYELGPPLPDTEFVDAAPF